MGELLKKEEVMWKQRSRIDWIREGDKNTAYFYRSANRRRQRNNISKLCMDNGVILTEEGDIETAFRSYFGELFTHREDIEITEAIDAIDHVVSPAMNEKLSAPFTEEDILFALSQMHPTKAPGPDDDSIIFGKANEYEITEVKRILEVYERASGQMVSLEKSEIAFSAGTDDTLADALAVLLGARRVPKHGVYLGMPCTVGRSKKQIFQLLEDRIWKKLKDWKKKYLSFAGRSTLLKSVAQAIPTYLMSIFLLPEQTAGRMNSMMASFLWGQNKEEKRIHWVNWKSLCRPKGVGGLGFRDIVAFNRALLAKQAWRILHNRDSMICRLLRAKYFPRITFLDAMHAHNPSFTWRSIMAGRKILNHGLIWRVGDGTQIRIWKDRWLPSAPDGRVFQEVGIDESNMVVAQLLSEDGFNWDHDKIYSLFPVDIVEQILAIPLPRHRGDDRLIWKHTKNGIYTVKSGYGVACQWRDDEQSIPTSAGGDNRIWRWLHGLRVIPKIHHFMWRCIKGVVPIAAELRKKHVECEIMCRRCGETEETLEHALRDCTWSSFFWRASPLRGLHLDPTGMISVREWIEKIMVIDDDNVHIWFAVLLWINWRQRNSLVFDENLIPHEICLKEAQKLFTECIDILGKTPMQHGEKEVELWRKPPAGVWKVNVDAALSPLNHIGIGILIRNEHGHAVTCKCLKATARCSPEIAEGLACQEGLVLAKEMGGTRVIVETDCQSLFFKLKGNAPDFSSMGEIVKSIQIEATSLEGVRYS